MKPQGHYVRSSHPRPLARMQYFASRGYSMDSFVRNRIGPMVISDELH